MKGSLVMIYIQIHIYECQEIKKIFNVQMEIVCDKKINELMNYRVICSRLITIIQ